MMRSEAGESTQTETKARGKGQHGLQSAQLQCQLRGTEISSGSQGSRKQKALGRRKGSLECILRTTETNF